MLFIPSKTISTLILATVFIATWIYPKWPFEQLLHSSLTFVGLVLLWRYMRHYVMSDKEYFSHAFFNDPHVWGKMALLICPL